MKPLLEVVLPAGRWSCTYLLEGALWTVLDDALYCGTERVREVPQGLLPYCAFPDGRMLWLKTWVGEWKNAMGTQTSVPEGRLRPVLLEGEWREFGGDVLEGDVSGSTVLVSEEGQVALRTLVNADPFGDSVCDADLFYVLDLKALTATFSKTRPGGRRQSLPIVATYTRNYVHGARGLELHDAAGRPVPVSMDLDRGGLVCRTEFDVLGLDLRGPSPVVRWWKLDDAVLRACRLPRLRDDGSQVRLDVAPLRTLALEEWHGELREPFDPGVKITFHPDGQVKTAGFYRQGKLEGWELRVAPVGQSGVLHHSAGSSRRWEGLDLFEDHPLTWVEWANQACEWMLDLVAGSGERTPAATGGDEVWCRVDASWLGGVPGGGAAPPGTNGLGELRPGLQATFYADGQLKSFGSFEGRAQGPQLALAQGEPKSSLYPGTGWRTWVEGQIALIKSCQWLRVERVPAGAVYWPSGQLRTLAAGELRLELEEDVPRGVIWRKGEVHMLYRDGGKMAFEGGKLHPERWEAWTGYWVRMIGAEVK